MKNSPEIKVFPRVPTGIKGLDTILGGGFLKGGIYLLMGPPGSGKTILANQFGFNFVAAGNRALYVSLLSESHSRLFGHLKPMRFFNEDRIAEAFNFVSAYHTLEKEGLDGLLKSIAQTVRQYKATLLFIDGVASAEELAKSPVSFKKFVHDLNTVLSVSGCTALLLSSLNHDSHPEHTMVDGIIALSSTDSYMRSTREIEVSKLRGSKQLTGRHVFTISDAGISVYPRIESYLGRQGSTLQEGHQLVSTGTPKLDDMLGGGLIEGSMTALIGAAGSGKTLLGTQFLTAGNSKENSLYFGFYESPPRLLRKAEKVFPQLKKMSEQERLRFVWQPPFERHTDEVTHLLLEEIERHNVKRLFIDGIVGFSEGLTDPQRLSAAFSALANELRARGVTTIFTEETKLFPMEVETPVSDHSAITDNIIYLRHADMGPNLYRFISVLKSRETRPDRRIREFEIEDGKGFLIRDVKDGLDGLITGTPHLVSKSSVPASVTKASSSKQKNKKASKARGKSGRPQ